jgi:hypothetical protein
MSLISLVLVLVCVGIGLYLLNQYGGAYIDGKILKLINVVVVVACILWVASAFGLLDACRTVQVPRVGN